MKQWQGGEAAARAAGVPITVLFDEYDSVMAQQGAQGCPTMYLVTRDGTILYEGSSDEDGPYWEAFERLDAMSAEAV